MERQHTIRVSDTPECLGVEFTALTFSADIELNLHPEAGDGHTTPREPAHAELNKVTQVSGPYMKPDELLEWAHCWVDNPLNQIRIAGDIRDTEPF